MDVQMIRCLLGATQNFFNTMLKLPVSFGAPHALKEPPPHDITSRITISGDVVGQVVVGLPKSAASAIVERFAGAAVDFGTPDFCDAIGEVVNMIAGGAKSRLEGRTVSISCPIVKTKSPDAPPLPTGAETVGIPCASPAGMFTIVLAIQSASNATAATKAAAAT